MRLGRATTSVSMKAAVLALAPKAQCAKEVHEFVVRLDGEILGKAENAFVAWRLAHTKLTFKEPTTSIEERRARLQASLERLWE